MFNVMLLKVERLVDDEGWFHTGDVGYFDEEGYVYAVDRVKEVLKCNQTYVKPGTDYETLVS